jgi:hypothetical protein
VFQQYSQEQKVITFARTNLHETEDATLETESLSMNSDPTESIASSCHDKSHISRGHHRHHRHSSQTNSVVPLAETTQKSHHRHKKNKHKPASQSKDVTIEILNDSYDDPRQPFDVASKPTKEKKIMTPAPPTVLANNDEESPMPPSVFDTSSSDSSSKQKLSSTMSCPTEDYSSNSAPTPVGFVFDDSNKSFTKNKLYRATPSPTSTPHGPEEDVSLATSLPTNERNYHSSEARTGAAGQTMPETRSLSRNLSSYSSDSSKSAEQEHTDQYEIVADAVLVDDPEIYDAELMPERESSNESRTPKIDINLYTATEGESRDKGQGCCDSKFCLPISILLAVIVGAIFIILGVVLGLKRQGQSTVTTNIATSTENSQLVVDDHSQTSNIFYNPTTNHYFVQYQNGTAADVVSIPQSIYYATLQHSHLRCLLL